MSGVIVPPRADGAPDGSRPVGREPVIRTRRLTKRYGTLTAVDALDLEIFRGEIFGLLGQNGAGKTTTILMLLGLSEPTDGEAEVMGLDPAREPREVKRRVGYLPDAVGFYGDLTGRQNLRYTARLNGLGRRDAESAIDEVLDQVSLSDRADDPVDTYSRGMRQRLGIADALVKTPDLLILDEPTTAIDPLGVVEILALLRRLVTERGLAIMLSSHLLTQVQSVCDRIGIFAAGRLIGQGSVGELARMFGDGTATIEVALELPTPADVERAGAALRAIPAVERVDEPSDAMDVWRLIVRPADAEGRVRQDVLLAAVQHGLHLTAIRLVVPSLDDIYRVAVARPAPPRPRPVRAGDRERPGGASGTTRPPGSGSAGGRGPGAAQDGRGEPGSGRGSDGGPGGGRAGGGGPSGGPPSGPPRTRPVPRSRVARGRRPS